MFESIRYLAMAAQDAPAGPQGPQLQQMVMMIAMFGLAFYFIVFRPQKREQKKKEAERKDMMDNLGKGDRIVTIGGIHGVVVDAAKGGETVKIKIDPKCVMRINRSAVSTIKTGKDDEGDSK